jgi:hypothetical protein
VNALRQIHAALVTGGRLVDTQPVGVHPRIETGGATLGTLDMTEWARTIVAIDQRFEEAIDAGLFGLEQERQFIVTDEYDDGPEFVAETREWQGTHIDAGFAHQLAREQRPVRLHQEIRLRVLRTL